MATYNKFYAFVENQWISKIDWDADVFKVMLTNTAPVATNSIKSDLTDISAVNGYTAGGTATTISTSRSTGTLTVSGTQVTFTASGGSIGPFQYAVLYDDTITSPVKPLVMWADYGTPLTITDGNSLIVKFNNASPGTIHTVT